MPDRAFPDATVRVKEWNIRNATTMNEDSIVLYRDDVTLHDEAHADG
jgi:hypothetical protein